MKDSHCIVIIPRNRSVRQIPMIIQTKLSVISLRLAGAAGTPLDVQTNGSGSPLINRSHCQRAFRLRQRLRRTRFFQPLNPGLATLPGYTVDHHRRAQSQWNPTAGGDQRLQQCAGYCLQPTRPTSICLSTGLSDRRSSGEHPSRDLRKPTDPMLFVPLLQLTDKEWATQGMGRSNLIGDIELHVSGGAEGSRANRKSSSRGPIRI
jgi:hypothetical protein